MDVASWLRDLGLQNYVQAFCANDIDAEVLSRLTAEDLIALGVSSIGHRRKLLDAIALLHDGSATGCWRSRSLRRGQPRPSGGS